MIRLLTDSTCDLPQDLVKKYNIEVLPLIVTLGEDVFYDGVDIKQNDIFEYVKKTGVLPKTSARNAFDLKEFFETYTDNGDEVIFCGIGSKLSSNFANAELAKSEMVDKDKVHLVDSCNLSTGTGMVLIEGAKAIANLKKVDEVVEIMNNAAKHLVSSFMVDKLDFLYKGGRCSRFSFSMANLLHIKPRLEVVDGMLLNTGKELGPYKICLRKYIDSMLKKYNKPKRGLCMITHPKCAEEYVDFFVNYIKSKNLFDEVVVADAGCVITSHCGENTIGFFYFNDMED